MSSFLWPNPVGRSSCPGGAVSESTANAILPFPLITWSAQSRQNFEAVSRLVTPGEPLQSLLLMHPLEPAAGGDEFHNGGRQFTSQSDPPFQTIAAWVRGEPASALDVEFFRTRVQPIFLDKRPGLYTLRGVS